MSIYLQKSLDFEDVLIVPQSGSVNSRKDVNLNVDYGWFRGIPIVASNMDTVGTFETARILSKFQMLTCLHKFYEVEDFKKYEYDSRYISLSCGITDKDLQRIKSILNFDPSIKIITVDVANGYTPNFRDFLKKIKILFPECHIIAGNVCTIQKSLWWSLQVDVIKLGIGSGDKCKTRVVTGIGKPQFSTVYDCASMDFSKLLMSDGGIREFGDVAKAFGAGANFVMIGSLFAGFKDNIPGYNGEEQTEVYGMASKTAHTKYYPILNATPEGMTEMVPVRESLEEYVTDLLGGLRSSLTYTGKSELSDFIGNVDFYTVNRTHHRK